MKKKLFIGLVFIFVFFSFSLFSLTPELFLTIGPVNIKKPLFEKNDNPETILNEYGFRVKEFPKEGDFGFELSGIKYFWKLSEAIELKSSSLTYAVFYVSSDRFLNARVRVKANAPFIIEYNGKVILKRFSQSDEKIAKGKISIEPGKWMFLIKIYIPENFKNSPEFKIKITPDKDYEGLELKATVSPQRHLTLREILDVPASKRVLISPTGNVFSVFLSSREDGKQKNWVEIRSTKDGKLIRSFKDLGKLAQFKWRPDGLAFSFLKKEKGKAYIVEVFNDGSLRKIELKGKNIMNYLWSPDSKKIFYVARKEGKEFSGGAKQLLSLEDRQRGARDVYYLYGVYENGGFNFRLTSSDKTRSIESISPDGKYLLLSESGIDYKKRPYSFKNYYMVDLKTFSIKKLFKSYWVSRGEFIDNRRILFLGGPDSFGGVGLNLKEQKLANDYDTQAYIYEIETKKVFPITKDFYPSIRSFKVVDSRVIYFNVYEKSLVTIWKYDIKKRKFKKLAINYDFTTSFSVDKYGRKAVFISNNSNTPRKVYSMNLKNNRVKLIYFPAEEEFSSIKFGKVEDWNFKDKDGYEIVGRIYYPPNFDSSKKYPLIVYYYGGTMPVTRDFGGRYPKNYWASNGFVVYVLQPRGAVGFGQEFSAFHVNDWGGKSADDILEGIDKFVKAHSFVDPEKIGIIGASYGGYMTEYLTTKRDFSCAISHAGISLLPHYWGEGYWGYTYSAIATAFSFPWNRKEIYVERSPLFKADKIHTPLLLLHGDSDTNVPTGNSDELYTALKLLGREVEYIKFKGEDHWILGYKNRVKWSKTIVAWFMRWLKGQPEWWFSMYKKTRK